MDFEGPLSLKVVLQGQGVWRTGTRRYTVDAGYCLVLNQGESYSLAFETAEPIETFCPFFAAGFVEDALGTLLASDKALLDLPSPTLVVLADCHIHPAQGIDWPQAALDAFGGADLFVTLGDMGERRGLDALARFAPVVGVRGRDDEDDPRTAARLRVLEVAGLRLGCVFDPVEAGAAVQVDPLICTSAETTERLFESPLDALLWASTHKPSLDRAAGRLHVNPGSVTLPGKNAPASFAKLIVANGAVDAEIVHLR